VRIAGSAWHSAPMPSSFLAATTFEPSGRGRYRGRFDASWYQGRGAYGGVVAGAALRSMEHAVGDAERQVRSLAAHFCAPAVAGDAEVRVQVERAGKLVTYVTARVECGGEVVCVATATFGSQRAVELDYLEFSRPTVPPPAALEPVPTDVLPTFCQHFDFRFCVGAPPYSGASEAVVGGWIRPLVPAALDTPLVVGLLDAYPPSVLSRVEGIRPAASLDFTVHFFHPLARSGAREDGFYLRTGRSRWAGGGYSEDHQELWTEDGTLLAQCRQMVAILG
jgi:acyl-CoA thioesterase